MLNAYFKALAEIYQRGDAREESFYSCLETLLVQFAQATGREEIQVTVLPKKTEAGNPDFRVWDGRNRIVGYVEAKNPAELNLDQVERSPQLRRYRETFPNLILTNFFEFRLYRDGELVNTVLAARPFVLHELGTTPPVEKEQKLLELLEQFFSFSLPPAFTAESLAVELAKRTRLLRQVVAQQLGEEQAAQRGGLLGFYQAFQKYLIALLSPEEFADLYAQTVAYGLFAARTRAGDGFDRRAAFYAIPRTIGILRDLFRYISLEDPPPQIQWVVDDIVGVLDAADVGNILNQYYRRGKGEDPIVHFYETFLAAYNPQEREQRGVYYTPEPVVGYIVRSLHHILKEKFGAEDGLASEGVTLLDPAAGTMTFVAQACREAVAEFVDKYGAGGREVFIRGHILRNFYAFELMMAPYAVGHLKMALVLERLGYVLKPDERFPFYLTNTLEMEELEQTFLPGMASLAEESHLAGQVKREQPILVIMGNPPYSGHSANRGVWIRGLVEDYKRVDGKPLGERNPKWLQDDYVKFLRFAQWKIEQAGRGVVGMITNHAYLDNPTFRGMRQSLMETFDEIYLLDLHGNSLKREVCPDGSQDGNVFDIRQGVAITLFLKHGQGEAHHIFHADLWGRQKKKYEWLTEHDRASTSWEELEPCSPFYLFIPYNGEPLEQYKEFVPVPEIFPANSTGIVTARDRFAFDFDRETLKRRIRTFLDPGLPDDLVRRMFNLRDNRDWKMAQKRRKLREDEQWEEKIIRCLYRPFDVRWLFYHPHAIDRARQPVVRHLLAGENLALVVPRRVEIAGGWHHALVTRLPVEHVVVSLKTIDYCFPLYRYLDENDLFNTGTHKRREPNLHPRVVAALTGAYGREPTPEEVFHYVYAVLYAPSYRERYAAFLKVDFPRIPFTADPDCFLAMARLGERLVALHLLRPQALDPPAARFHGEGDSTVARGKRGPRYDPQEQRVYVNATQYFVPVSPEVWDYTVGGYQVLRKWLLDRRGRRLALEEIRTYCRIVTALERTIALQEEIDALYGRAEKEVIRGGI